MWGVSVVRPDGVLLIHRGSRWNPSAVLFDTREAMRLFLDKCSGRYLARWIDDGAAKDVRTFLKGIILGDRSEIGYTVRSTFADSGLVHSLSASGVHVAIVALLALIRRQGHDTWGTHDLSLDAFGKDFRARVDSCHGRRIVCSWEQARRQSGPPSWE